MKTPMNTMTKAIRPVLLCLPLVLSGCFGLSRGAPVQQHYVLGAGEQVDRVALVGRSAAEATVVGLRPPRVAEYLATSYIVVRQGTHRIGFSEFHRWGEDLARGINRTLAGHMAAWSPDHRVETVPWTPGVRPDYLIQLHLLRFEGIAPEDLMDRAGEAHLLATWEIVRSRDGAVLLSRTTEVRSDEWMVGDFDGLVSLLDAGLSTLAEDLVLGLEHVHASSDGPEAP